jgi:CheY-like chemotaxis protein
VNRGSILVVDDDYAIRETLRAILEDEGYPVAVASNGQDALAQLTQAPRPPALCIVDLVMPVLDGWELCNELARRPPLNAVPVLLVSANTELDRTPAGLETVHHMKKPISFEKLLGYIERYCHGG